MSALVRRSWREVGAGFVLRQLNSRPATFGGDRAGGWHQCSSGPLAGAEPEEKRPLEGQESMARVGGAQLLRGKGEALESRWSNTGFHRQNLVGPISRRRRRAPLKHFQLGVAVPGSQRRAAGVDRREFGLSVLV